MLWGAEVCGLGLFCGVVEFGVAVGAVVPEVLMPVVPPGLLVVAPLLVPAAPPMHGFVVPAVALEFGVVDVPLVEGILPDGDEEVLPLGAVVEAVPVEPGGEPADAVVPVAGTLVPAAVPAVAAPGVQGVVPDVPLMPVVVPVPAAVPVVVVPAAVPVAVPAAVPVGVPAAVPVVPVVAPLDCEPSVPGCAFAGALVVPVAPTLEPDDCGVVAPPAVPVAVVCAVANAVATSAAAMNMRVLRMNSSLFASAN